MLSVETNSISFNGLAVDGEYSMINVPSELCNGVGDSGLRLSTATVLSLTLISLDGMIVFDAIPSVTVQSGVVEDAVPINNTKMYNFSRIPLSCYVHLFSESTTGKSTTSFVSTSTTPSVIPVIGREV
jgi:hypothetical protein